MELKEIQRSGVEADTEECIVEGNTEECSRRRYRGVELIEIQRSGVDEDTELRRASKKEKEVNKVK